MENFLARVTSWEASRFDARNDRALVNMFVSYSLRRPRLVTSVVLPGTVTDSERVTGSDTLITAGVHLLTPPVREIYALLVRAGILVVEE